MVRLFGMRSKRRTNKKGGVSCAAFHNSKSIEQSIEQQAKSIEVRPQQTTISYDIEKPINPCIARDGGHKLSNTKASYNKIDYNW